MYKHHKETIERLVEELRTDETVLGILLTGSIAHGFAMPKSDVDIMIIISEEDYESKAKIGKLTYWNKKICTYEDGYVDGKYISRGFMEKVAESGSEPARFAFEGAVILYTKIEALDALLQKITTYPTDKKAENVGRFFAQLEAWKWYAFEAIKHNNEYLLNHSVSNLVLFGGRLILAYNEVLYPYHKWFMKVLDKVKQKPENIMSIIGDLLSNKNKENIERFYECIIHFADWDIDDLNWSSQFVIDSELNWLGRNTPINDI